MSRRSVSLALSLLLVICASTAQAKSYVPKKNTRAAVKSWVDHAAKVVAKNGPACDTLKEKNWMSGDYYIFVLGPDDRLVCHPNASMIGKKDTEIVDSSGRKVGAEVSAAAKSKAGHGWVNNYMWPRPGQDKPSPKSSYAVHVKGPGGKWYVVGGGGYDMK